MVVARFVAAQQGKLVLFFLPPCSPELTPDELVWNDLLAQLRQMIVSHMRQPQKLPALCAASSTPLPRDAHVRDGNHYRTINK